MKRLDIASNAWVKRLLRSRWPQFALILVTLAGFILAIVAGLLGTKVGSRNFGIVVVWIGWWALLMLIAVPLLGRGWCSICPIPAPAEWLQRGAVLGPLGGGLSLRRRWPRALRNIWVQNAAFAVLAIFSVVILTQPVVTAWLLLGLLLAAIITSLIFERRAFCRYLCPVGGFIGLYSQLAPTELRIKDTAICASHRDKTCYTGNADGYGCPWQVFPAALVKNINCGLCFECVRTCPYDNIAFNLRPFGTDLLRPSGRKLDEAFKAFIMLGSAIIYVVVLLGPWGALKTAAYSVGSLSWIVYALGFVVFVFGLLPGAFWLAVLTGRALAGSKRSLRGNFIHFSYSLVPLGLAAWIAFSLSFVFANFSYMWGVFADPMGWGWSLLGMGGSSWRPYLTGLVPMLQVGALLGGLIWASLAARRVAADLFSDKRHSRAAAPIISFNLLVTLGLLQLLVG